MTPFMNPFRDASERESNERLEQCLRAGAPVFGPTPSPALRGRILQALRTAPRTPERLPEDSPERRRNESRQRAGSWLAAAAALLVLSSAWWLTHRSEVSEVRRERASPVLAVSRGILEAGTRVLTFPRQAEGSLRQEGQKLLADTTRVADGNMDRWAAKLCARAAKRASAGVLSSLMRSRRMPSSTTTTARRIAFPLVLTSNVLQREQGCSMRAEGQLSLLRP